MPCCTEARQISTKEVPYHYMQVTSFAKELLKCTSSIENMLTQSPCVIDGMANVQKLNSDQKILASNVDEKILQEKAGQQLNRFLRNSETMKQLMHYIISEWRKIFLVSRWAGKKYTAQ